MTSALYVPVSIKNIKSLEDGSQTFFLHVFKENIFVGQAVIFTEFNRDTLQYTGKTLKKTITYIQNLNDGYCILALGSRNK